MRVGSAFMRGWVREYFNCVRGLGFES